MKEVSDGYFRNFLFPRHLAKHATTDVLKEAGEIRKQSGQRVASDRKQFVEMLEVLKTRPIKISRKANEEGHLFGSVTPKDILDELEKQGYKGLEDRHIHIDPAIKTVGTHQITVRPMPELEGVVEIIVEKNA